MRPSPPGLWPHGPRSERLRRQRDPLAQGWVGQEHSNAPQWDTNLGCNPPLSTWPGLCTQDLPLSDRAIYQKRVIKDYLAIPGRGLEILSVKCLGMWHSNSRSSKRRTLWGELGRCPWGKARPQTPVSSPPLKPNANSSSQGILSIRCVTYTSFSLL